MKKIKSLICALLLLSMLTSMFLTVNAAETNRSGISVDRMTSKNKIGESATYPEGYYVTDKRLDKAPVTFEYWAYIPAKVYNSASGVVLSNFVEIGATTNTDDWFSLTIEPKGSPRLAIGYSDGRTYDKTFGSLIPKETWTHISLVLDQSARKLKVYVNGVYKSQLGFGDGSKASILNENMDNMLYLLSDARRGNNKAMCDIKISDVAMYSDARSADEIKSDYTNGADVSDENIMLCYQISSANKEKDIKDASGNGYDMKYYRTFITESEMNEIRKQENKDYAYSIVLLPDTHFWLGQPANKRKPIVDYIIENEESKNIQYVIGLGDMSGDGKKEEWAYVKEEYGRLDKAGIPYTAIRGNHDTIRDSSYFNKLFGPGTAYYSRIEETGGFYKTNSSVNTYTCFKANGNVDYMILNLDFGINSKILSWANQVILQHPNHRVIVVTHAWLGSDGAVLTSKDPSAPSAYDSTFLNPDYIWEKCLSKHSNIDMIVSGHTHSDQILTTPVVGNKGNIVYQVLVNNQCSPDYYKGLCNVAIMNFTADGRFANIAYYAAIHDKYFYEGNADISFDFDAVNSASVDISGKVSLTGNDISEGQFGFLLKSADSKFAVDSKAEPIKAVNISDGSFVFEDVTFKKAGTYYFVLSADTTVGTENVTFDESIYYVTVEVAEDSKGFLEATEVLITKKGSTQKVDSVVFTNEYVSVNYTGILIWIAVAVVCVAAIVVAVVLIIKKKRAKKN